MFPSTLSTFAQPSATDRLNSPSHSTLHNTVSSALGQVEAVIGTDASTLGTIIGDLRSASSDGGGHIQSANKGGTGQTSYTKGDTLVASSSSVLTKLTVGSNDTVLIADSTTATGVKWGAVPAIIVSSTIAVTSVWTKPTAATATSRVFVELWGGGGSGAAGATTSEAAGGGGGGYASGWFNASVLSSVIINVGRGGDAVLADSSGLPGNITVFDVRSSLLTAYAGGGGQVGNGNPIGGSGAGTMKSGLDGNNNTDLGGLIGGSRSNTADSTFVINTGANTSSIFAYNYRAPIGGGGGSGALSATAGTITSLIGGYALYGGAGGSGIGSSVVSGSVQGGLSTFGGNGGASSVLYGASASAMAGSIPGGGGGASWGNANTGSSGPGGHGMARITVFL